MKTNPLSLLALAKNDPIQTVDTILHGILDEDVRSLYDLTELKRLLEVVKVDRLKDETLEIIHEMLVTVAVNYISAVVDTLNETDVSITERVSKLEVEINDVASVDSKLNDIMLDPVLKERIELVCHNFEDEDLKLKLLSTDLIVRTNPVVLKGLLSIPAKIAIAIEHIAKVDHEHASVKDIILETLEGFYKENKDKTLESLNLLTDVDMSTDIEPQDHLHAIKLSKSTLIDIEDKISSYTEELDKYKPIDLKDLINSYAIKTIIVKDTAEDELKKFNSVLNLLIDIKKTEAVVLNSLVDNIVDVANKYNERSAIYLTIINTTHV